MRRKKVLPLALAILLLLSGCGKKSDYSWYAGRTAEENEMTKVLNNNNGGIMAEDQDNIYYQDKKNHLRAFHKETRADSVLVSEGSPVWMVRPLEAGLLYEQSVEDVYSLYLRKSDSETITLYEGYKTYEHFQIGETIIFETELGIHQYDLNGEQIHLWPVPPDGEYTQLYEYDGSLYFVYRDRSLETSPKHDASILRITPPSNDVESLDEVLDGTSVINFLVVDGNLYYTTGSDEIVRYNLERREREILRPFDNYWVIQYAIFQYLDGELIFCARKEGGNTVYGFDVATKELRKITGGFFNWLYVIDGKLYGTAIGKNWTCIDLETGKRQSPDLPGLN